LTRLTYKRGIHHPGSLYSGHGLSAVRVGQVVEVDTVDAERLMVDFPGCWAYADREMRPSLAFASIPVLSILDQSLVDFAEALSTGAYDSELDQLERAEQAGKTRKGALRLIADRRNLEG